MYINIYQARLDQRYCNQRNNKTCGSSIIMQKDHKMQAEMLQHKHSANAMFAAQTGEVVNRHINESLSSYYYFLKDYVEKQCG